jgi:hypothetical protein
MTTRNIQHQSSTNDTGHAPLAYDYTLKFLLVGDNDVGKDEIFQFIDRSTILSDSLQNNTIMLNTNSFSSNNMQNGHTFKGIN